MSPDIDPKEPKKRGRPKKVETKNITRREFFEEYLEIRREEIRGLKAGTSEEDINSNVMGQPLFDEDLDFDR